MNAYRRRGLPSSLVTSFLLSSAIVVATSGCASTSPSNKGSSTMSSPSTSPSSQPSTTAPTDAKTTAFIALLAQGKFDDAEASFDAAMRGALPPSKLAETWKAVESKLGAFEAIEKIDNKTHEGYVLAHATSKFQRDRLVIKVVFDDKGSIAGLFFLPAPVAWSAPPYAAPASFEEREVQVGSSPPLPGTLTMPKHASSQGVPAVVLVHGSGPNDRDESIAAIKPFKDLAWGLASKGIAVLRYDKRTKVHPQGVVTQKEEVLDGAREAVRLLQSTPGVDPKRIFVVGHSQGGYLAPRIAEANPDLAGVIILAGATQPLQDSIIEQLSYFHSMDPKNTQLEAQLAKARVFKTAVESPSLKPEDDVALPFGSKVKGAYFLDVRGYEPHVAAATLSCRLLVLQGERDYQVTMVELERFKKTLAGKKNATLKTYPSLNHLFVSGTGKPGPAEYDVPGHVDQAVIDDISGWITAR